MLRQIGFEEVEQHGSVHNCWLVLGRVGSKRVYDVTAFLEDHPGGPELLLDLAGQDAHDEFEDIGHSRAAREMLQELCIGELRHDSEAHAKREARTQERRSLLLMQVPALGVDDGPSTAAATTGSIRGSAMISAAMHTRPAITAAVVVVVAVIAAAVVVVQAPRL